MIQQRPVVLARVLLIIRTPSAMRRGEGGAVPFDRSTSLVLELPATDATFDDDMSKMRSARNR
jgi:hypothetical protein